MTAAKSQDCHHYVPGFSSLCQSWELTDQKAHSITYSVLQGKGGSAVSYFSKYDGRQTQGLNIIKAFLILTEF